MVAAAEPRPIRSTSTGSTSTGVWRSATTGRYRARVQAARLRLVTDGKQKKQSPEWVKRLANGGR